MRSLLKPTPLEVKRYLLRKKTIVSWEIPLGISFGKNGLTTKSSEENICLFCLCCNKSTTNLNNTICIEYCQNIKLPRHDMDGLNAAKGFKPYRTSVFKKLTNFLQNTNDISP